MFMQACDLSDKPDNQELTEGKYYFSDEYDASLNTVIKALH